MLVFHLPDIKIVCNHKLFLLETVYIKRIRVGVHINIFINIINVTQFVTRPVSPPRWRRIADDNALVLTYGYPFSVQFRQLSNLCGLDHSPSRRGIFSKRISSLLCGKRKTGKSSYLFCQASPFASNCNRAARLLGNVSAWGRYSKETCHVRACIWRALTYPPWQPLQLHPPPRWPQVRWETAVKEFSGSETDELDVGGMRRERWAICRITLSEIGPVSKMAAANRKLIFAAHFVSNTWFTELNSPSLVQRGFVKNLDVRK